MKDMDMFGDKNRPAFGIDLGTTNSCISVLKSGKIPTIIPVNEGKVTLPSCVMWKGGDKFIVGQEAYDLKFKANVASSVKRIIGTDEKVTLEYGGKKLVLTPEEVSAKVLKELADKASEKYGKVQDVVITVPAYFNNNQIEATIRAGKLAGLNVLKTFREPTSAALTYVLDDIKKPEVTVLVYDLGGGTFDISLLKITKAQDTSEIDAIYGFEKTDETSGALSLSVLKTDGNSRLGGDDIDNELYKILAHKLREQGFDPNYIPVEEAKSLKHRLEYAKKNANAVVSLSLDFKMNDKEGTRVKTSVYITPEDSFNATKKIYDQTKICMDRALNGINLDQIDCILLVGGSTKSQVIKTLLAKDYPSVFISDALNPDESVALGAGIEAKRIKFGMSDMKVYDVIPLGIGVLADDRIVKIIPKNQMVPYTATRNFGTTIDDQEQIGLHFYQGNSSIREECTYIGSLVIKDIPKGKAGSVKVKVAMTINADGVLKCRATIGNIDRSIELTNLFTGKEDNPSPLTDIDMKKYNRWKRLVNRIDNPKKQSEFKQLLENFKNHKADEKVIVEFIKVNC